MASQPINPKTQSPFRPTHLPPPTELPLRHCSHNEDSTPIDESACLLSLFSPSPDSKKNREHYILATADPPSPEKVAASAASESRKRKRELEEDAEEAMRKAKALRVAARAVPGVPVVYVKRSVMVLEPMSEPSVDVREGVERGKFRAGIEEKGGLGKRKRDNEDGKRKGGVKKAKGPNPLSMKKPKSRDPGTPRREKQSTITGGKEQDDDGDRPDREREAESAPKPKRKRRHNKSAKRDDEADPTGPAAESTG